MCIGRHQLAVNGIRFGFILSAVLVPFVLARAIATFTTRDLLLSIESCRTGSMQELADYFPLLVVALNAVLFQDCRCFPAGSIRFT